MNWLVTTVIVIGTLLFLITGWVEWNNIRNSSRELTRKEKNDEEYK